MYWRDGNLRHSSYQHQHGTATGADGENGDSDNVRNKTQGNGVQ